MKHTYHINRKKIVRSAIFTLLFIGAGLSLISFSVAKLNTEFLSQLGIGKSQADSKIFSSILNGSLDTYGLKNVKNIATGNRTAVTKELLAYTKTAVNSEAFKKQYNELKNTYKPTFEPVQTPEDFKKETLKRYRDMVVESEKNAKEATGDMKPIFEKVLAESKKQLKEIEDPNNKMFVRYEKNYAETVRFNQSGYDHQVKRWEDNYPSNHLLFVKKRLEEFLVETDGIDFAAELKIVNGKKVFVNRQYEGKGNRWKMAFRAGKQVVEPAREFVKKWIGEIEGQK